jgi:hypothetical protein
VEHVRGEDKIEILVGIVQAMERIAYGHLDRLVIEPFMAKEPPRLGGRNAIIFRRKASLCTGYRKP